MNFTLNSWRKIVRTNAADSGPYTAKKIRPKHRSWRDAGLVQRRDTRGQRRPRLLSIPIVAKGIDGMCSLVITEFRTDPGKAGTAIRLAS